MEHRITIVDDEGEVRSALRRLFKVAGMKTAICFSEAWQQQLKEAIAKARYVFVISNRVL